MSEGGRRGALGVLSEAMYGRALDEVDGRQSRRLADLARLTLRLAELRAS